jgi:hypothetical protein
MRAKNGGADRDQTDDLVIANDALYQLSYCPMEGRDVLGRRFVRVNINFAGVCSLDLNDHVKSGPVAGLVLNLLLKQNVMGETLAPLPRDSSRKLKFL